MDEEARTPDPNYHDRLLSAPMSDDDEEMMRVIELSRQEYAEQEARRIKREKLREQLAVPASRLKLWADTTTDDHERECLRRLLAILHAKTSDDEADANTPLDDELTRFADKHLRRPRLFQGVYNALTGNNTSCTLPGGG